jgi:hypothetical protein
MKEEDFLSGLYYCLQKGYYNENILKHFFENILSKNDYQFLSFEEILQE